jgi:hypothetical protein
MNNKQQNQFVATHTAFQLALDKATLNSAKDLTKFLGIKITEHHKTILKQVKLWKSTSHTKQEMEQLIKTYKPLYNA